MTIVIIDSSARDIINYPINNSFVFKFNQSYPNIKKIKLLGGCFPNSQYIVNVNNKNLIVNNATIDYTFVIPEGNYTPVNLASQLQTTLNTNNFGVVFTVTSNYITNKFRFQSSSQVIYKFSTNLYLGTILGFTTDTILTNDVTSTNCYSVNSTRYYRVVISELTTNYVSNKQNNGLTFTIMNNVNSGEYNYINSSNNVNNNIILDQINISQLSICVYDEFNYKVLLNGIEFFLILQMK